MSLRKSALSGVLWTFIQQVSTQGVSFVVSIILARLLLPQDFGLIAMLGVIMTISLVMVDSGMAKSIIRTKDPDQEDYSTIFYFNLLISLILSLIIYFSAPLIAKFYNQSMLIPVARVYCIVFIINSLSIIQNAKLAKELDFKKQTIIAVPSIIIGAIVGIVMAYKGYGVWSLVWSAIIKSTAFTIQLWLWSPWKPVLTFNLEKIKYHFNFGYKLTVAGIIDAVFRDLYTIIIGRFFDPIQVGFYNRANTLRMFPVKNFSTVLNKVTYPLFSKIQEDDVRLKSVYRKIMLIAVSLVSPTLFLMAALAEPLFRFLLTEKWLPAVPYFQILCFNGVLFPIHSYNLNVLTVKGRTDLFLKLEILKKIFTTIVVIISFQWGIYGLLYGSVFVSIISLIINTHYTGKYINYNLVEQLKDFLPTLILALLIGIGVFWLDLYIIKLGWTDILRLTVGFIIGIGAFIGIAYAFKMQFVSEIKGLLSKR